jgi:hypothetical protein
MQVLTQVDLWYQEGRCVSCGQLLLDNDVDVLCCSERCHMLYDNYMAWRASFRESNESFQVPKFPFFRSPHE